MTSAPASTEGAATPGAETSSDRPPSADAAIGPAVSDGTRRTAKRRPAGAARGKLAANDDIPSIGGLIYALEQKPSKKPYTVALVLSVIWLALGTFFAYAMIAPELARSAAFADLLAKPIILTALATVIFPVVLFWFLAWLLYQAQDLRLRSSAMTEVAIRLAEPDRTAEQAVVSLGQSVRKQVNFMNEAVSRAIGRAGELEAMVHNEVASLERSFADNETRIRSVIGQLANERNNLTSTSDDVHKTLRAMGDEVPALIEKLSEQQTKLAKIIEGAGQNLIALESSLLKASGQLETSIGDRTEALQGVLTGHSGHLQTLLDEYTQALHSSLGARTGELQGVFEQFTLALDTTLQNRAEALDSQLVERTTALDAAFANRLQLFDDSVRQSTLLIDSSVGDKARALSDAMEAHARQLADTLGRQSANLDEQLMQGISAVRRTSENITRQSIKAIEGLSSQADMMKSVSENLLTQINSVTSRFENQGQSIMRAANALETANYRIDQTLQNRHRDLTETLGRVTGASEQLGKNLLTYRNQIEGTVSEAQSRTRALTEDLTRGAQSHAQQALSELERLKSDTAAHTSRALDEMRDQFSTASREMTAQVGSLSERLSQTSNELRSQAQAAADEFEREQVRLREEAARLPAATRESADAMRRVLADQMRALEQMTHLGQRDGGGSDIMPPAALPQAALARPAPGGAETRPYQPPPTLTEQMQVANARVDAASAQNRWSLGDLLARASVEQQPQSAPIDVAPQGAHVGGAAINLDSIARALDPQTAAAIWARFRNGQRGIMVRSIYTAEGRTTFDEVVRRFQIDGEFRAMVERFLTDFERHLRETEVRDPSGQTVQSQLVSNSGRVYLFLAHASGRLS
jgi:outer membrane murein-binding lipoprotein Lpp